MKLITFLLILSLLISFTSCVSQDSFAETNENTTEISSMSDKVIAERFKVFEVSGFDSVSGAKHSSEIHFEELSYQDSNAEKEVSIKVDGKDLNATYTKTESLRFYNSQSRHYRYHDKEKGITVEKGINSYTGNTDWYYFYNKNYLAEINKPELTRDECMEIAKKYFDGFIDSSEYEVTYERYMYVPEWKGVYTFHFSRIIDGIETYDYAIIGITVFGDVIDHSFLSLGEMKNAKLPSQDEMKMIVENVKKKLQDIYSNVEYKYLVNYQIHEPVFMRLADGRYAFEYFVEVGLIPKDDAEHTLSETTNLIVYVD